MINKQKNQKDKVEKKKWPNEEEQTGFRDHTCI